jgi:hypothetical protein
MHCDFDKIHHSQDLYPPSPALRQWHVGVDQKGGEPIARIWEERSPNDMRPENRKWCLQEKVDHELDKEFNSPNALNVTKTSILRYAGHMIRRPEDLPQKALFRAKPNEGEIKEDRNPGGRMGWTLTSVISTREWLWHSRVWLRHEWLIHECVAPWVCFEQTCVWFLHSCVWFEH